MRPAKFLTGFLPAVATVICLASTAPAQQNMTIEPVVSGLEGPWGVAPLPDQSALVTLKAGDLLYVKDGQKTPVTGVPDVANRGQGGLLDVTLARDFSASRTLFLTYAKDQGGGSGRPHHRQQRWYAEAPTPSSTYMPCTRARDPC